MVNPGNNELTMNYYHGCVMSVFSVGGSSLEIIEDMAL